MENNQNNLGNKHEEHLQKIANELHLHKFSDTSTKEVIDTLRGKTTSNIRVLNKEEKELVNALHIIREDTTAQAFATYLRDLLNSNNALFESYRTIAIKEKDYNIKLLERAITNGNVSKEKMIELQGNLLNSISLVKAFSVVINISLSGSNDTIWHEKLKEIAANEYNLLSESGNDRPGGVGIAHDIPLRSIDLGPDSSNTAIQG